MFFPKRPMQTKGFWFFLKAAATALTLAAAWFLAGCGVKTPPYPAIAVLPAQVGQLSQSLTDQGELILTWVPPSLNAVGRPLKSLGGFEIEMADNVINENYCETCPHKYEMTDMVPVLTPPPGLTLAPGPYTWRKVLQPGHVYHVKVTAVSKNGGRHPSSSVETVVWMLDAPGALPGFRASMEDKAAALVWNRPREGYQVEIDKKTASGDWVRLGQIESLSGRFLDMSVAYEQNYQYRGRLARHAHGSIIPGPWSAAIEVKVVDLVPPNPPSYLDAALADGGIKLSWDSLADDPEVAGYRLYRQLSGEAGFTQIGSKIITDNIYFDRLSLEARSSARYQVTAVDRSPKTNESRPSPLGEVFVEAPLEIPVRPE